MSCSVQLNHYLLNCGKESGVFDALKQSHLHVLHVFVTSNTHGDNTILETYTYTFEYRGPHVTGVRVGETGRAFSLSDSQRSFKAAIRALLRTMKDLPPFLVRTYFVGK